MHWADYLILAVYVLTTLGIGLYHGFKGRKDKSPEHFIMADRKLKLLPTALSMVVTSLSAIGILSSVAEMYTRGSMLFVWGSVAQIMASVIVSQVFIPWLFPLRLTSVVTYLLMRYNNLILVRVVSFFRIFTAVSWSAVALYAPSLALQTATGLSVYISVPVVSIVCIIFTSLGGMKAVVWTDVFQSLVMFGGCLTILVKACLAAGGFTEMFSVLNEEGRFKTEISPDPTVRHTVWGFLFGQTFSFILWRGIGQNEVQRFSAVPSLKQAKWLPPMFTVGYLILEGLAHLIGVAILAYYAKVKCDPMASGKINNPNEILPLFVREMFSGVPGFLGLFLASIYSSTISTVSTNLSGTSANALMDFVKPKFPNMSDKIAAKVSQIMVVIIGVLMLALALTVGEVEGPFLQISMSVSSLATGPVVAFYILGGLKMGRRIHLKSIAIGCAVSFSLVLWIFLGSMNMEGNHPPLPPVSMAECDIIANTTATNHIPITGIRRLYTMSYLWYNLLSTSVTIVIATICSFIFELCGKNAEQEDIQENLFMKVIRCCNHDDQAEHVNVPLEEPLNSTNITKPVNDSLI